jgi:indolepyruvate ferredoxin oxidoreductase
MLKSLGLDSKIEIGTWSKPLFAALQRGKRLRGSRLDPFGRTEMRRTEAALPDEFLATMRTVYEHLGAGNLEHAVSIAGLPDMIRGYEDLKLRRIAEYRSTVAAELVDYLD